MMTHDLQNFINIVLSCKENFYKCRKNIKNYLINFTYWENIDKVLDNFSRLEYKQYERLRKIKFFKDFIKTIDNDTYLIIIKKCYIDKLENEEVTRMCNISIRTLFRYKSILDKKFKKFCENSVQNNKEYNII